MNSSQTDTARTATCPFCDSTDTELIALFGMQMMTSQFYCRHCHSVFEAVKWEAPDDRPQPDEPESR